MSQHPLLIQKTMADRLSDKVQVIIAPPPASGGFIGNALLGATQTAARSAAAPDAGDSSDAAPADAGAPATTDQEN